MKNKQTYSLATRMLAIVLICICVILIARYTCQYNNLEGFQEKLQSQSRFIFAGYNPLYDFIITQRLLQYLGTTSSVDSPTKQLRFRDIPRLFVYQLHGSPDTLHIFITQLRKPQPLIEMVEASSMINGDTTARVSVSRATEAALNRNMDTPLPGIMSKEANMVGQMLTRRPPVTLNMVPTKREHELMRTYVKFFVEEGMMPLSDIMITDVDSKYLNLEPIISTAPNPEDTNVIPEIYTRDPERKTYTDLFTHDKDEPFNVNIITPNKLTEAKQLATKAAEEDIISTIKRILFDNPAAGIISKGRLVLFRHKIISTITGATVVIIYFRLADDTTELSQSQLIQQFVNLGIAEEAETEENPYYPDYILPIVPIHDYQQVQVIIKSTERAWEAS